MNILEIIKYCKDNNGVTIPELQAKYGTTYKKAKSIVDKLLTDGELAYDCGIKYNYIGNFGDLHEIEFENPEFEERLLGIEGHRRELDSRMRRLFSDEDDDDDEDEDDDDEDEESRAYDRLRESLLEKIERKSADDSGDKSDDGLRQTRERMGNLGKLFSIKKIFNDSINLRCDSKYIDNKMSNVIYLNGEQFKLDYDDGSLQIIYDGYAPGDCTSAMRANSIMKEYKSLHYKADAIVATVENNEDALDVLFELYAAVERIKHGE